MGHQTARQAAKAFAQAQAIPVDPRKKVDEIVTAIASNKPSRLELATLLLDKHFELLESDFVPLLLGDTVQEIPYDRVEGIVSLFYGKIGGAYVGVDSHVPSRFTSIHPFLLDHLVSKLETQLEAPYCYGHVARVLPITLKSLREDYRKNRPAFERYLRWHHRHGIVLLRVDPRVARDARLAADLWTTDIGLWIPACALLFEPQIYGEGRLRLQLVCPDDKDRFEQCVDYVKHVIRASTRIQLNGNSIVEGPLEEELREDLIWSLEGVFEPGLAKAWFDFVSPNERLRKREEEFLQQLLPDSRSAKIFDAAMGVGAESVFLKEKGFDVTPNEIDSILIEHARRYAASKDPPVSLNVLNCDWRHILSKLDPKTYDIVLCMGNSLSCLDDTDDMVKCLEGFLWLLKPDGKLIIDERNYRDMLKRRNSMLRSEFRFPGEVVYCGQIKAKPKDIPRNLDERRRELILEYYKDGEPVGTFTVYPYDQGQFEILLNQANFKVIETYWDFQKTEKEGAEFITYVATPDQS